MNIERRDFLKGAAVTGVAARNHCKDVEINIVLSEQFNGSHNAVEGALACVVHTIAVVYFLWAVQRHAHKHLMCGKPFCPFFIEVVAVGLYGVVYADIL